jgi:hypothetical protein
VRELRTLMAKVGISKLPLAPEHRELVAIYMCFLV